MSGVNHLTTRRCNARGDTESLGEIRDTVALAGDGLRVRASLVAAGACLRVVGEGTNVHVDRNEGEVHVVGDGGRVRICCNARGAVVYVGDGGNIRSCVGGQVRYTGDGGRVHRTACDEQPICDAASEPHPTGGKAKEDIYVAHRCDAGSEFKQIHVRSGRQPVSTINVQMTPAQCDEWFPAFSNGIWLMT